MHRNASPRRMLHTYVVRLRERMREIERTPAARGGRPEKPTGRAAVKDRDTPPPRDSVSFPTETSGRWCVSFCFVLLGAAVGEIALRATGLFIVRCGIEGVGRGVEKAGELIKIAQRRVDQTRAGNHARHGSLE